MIYEFLKTHRPISLGVHLLNCNFQSLFTGCHAQTPVERSQAPDVHSTILWIVLKCLSHKLNLVISKFPGIFFEVFFITKFINEHFWFLPHHMVSKFISSINQRLSKLVSVLIKNSLNNWVHHFVIAVLVLYQFIQVSQPIFIFACFCRFNKTWLYTKVAFMSKIHET